MDEHRPAAAAAEDQPAMHPPAGLVTTQVIQISLQILYSLVQFQENTQICPKRAVTIVP